MSTPRILFMDDEPFFAVPYIRELEKTFEVVLEETATGAINAVNSTLTWDALILDVMMPSPVGQRGVTADGLDTGLWILDQILDTVVSQSIPVLILTNRNIPRVREVVDVLDIPDGLVSVRSKIETPRFVLPLVIKAIVDKFHPTQGN